MLNLYHVPSVDDRIRLINVLVYVIIGALRVGYHKQTPNREIAEVATPLYRGKLVLLSFGKVECPG